MPLMGKATGQSILHSTVLHCAVRHGSVLDRTIVALERRSTLLSPELLVAEFGGHG